MNVLVFYNSNQTYTNTVFEHLYCIGKYSENRVLFCAHSQANKCLPTLDSFDAIILHYSIRLPYDQAAGDIERSLVGFPRLKVLFIQDEYDNTQRAWHWIKRLGFQLVFTTVPKPAISTIYPPHEFPDVTFVNNLTGYVPESLPAENDVVPPSKRELVVAYRGRPLPMRYGDLGADKVRIGEMVKSYCEAKGIRHDISWTEDSRIYGSAWYRFVASARSMLGTESGSNVFDWTGTLEADIARARAECPGITAAELYERVVRPLEQSGKMNQISPRIFEAIALRTILVLFDGTYSGVLTSGRHYLSLNHDGSNLDDVFAALADDALVDEMATRAFRDIVGSRRYSYANWVATVDGHLQSCFARLGLVPTGEATFAAAAHLTKVPIRATPSEPPPTTLRAAIMSASCPANIPGRLLRYAWGCTPEAARGPVRSAVRAIRSTIRAIRSTVRDVARGARSPRR